MKFKNDLKSIEFPLSISSVYSKNNEVFNNKITIRNRAPNIVAFAFTAKSIGTFCLIEKKIKIK